MSETEVRVDENSQDGGIAALASSDEHSRSNSNNSNKLVRDMEGYLSARRGLTSRHRIVSNALQMRKFLWIK